MKRVKKGETIKAKTMNDIIRLVNESANLAGGAQSEVHPAIVVLAQNVGETDLNLHDVCIVRGSSLSDGSKQVQTVLEVAIPDATDCLDIIAVCLEKIPSDQAGSVVIAGMCWAETDGGDGYYGTLEEGNNFLTIGDSGSVQIIDRDGSVALVRFPCGGGGGSGEGATITYQLEITGFIGFCTDQG